MEEAKGRVGFKLAGNSSVYGIAIFFRLYYMEVKHAIRRIMQLVPICVILLAITSDSYPYAPSQKQNINLPSSHAYGTCVMMDGDMVVVLVNRDGGILINFDDSTTRKISIRAMGGRYKPQCTDDYPNRPIRISADRSGNNYLYLYEWLSCIGRIAPGTRVSLYADSSLKYPVIAEIVKSIISLRKQNYSGFYDIRATVTRIPDR